MTMIVRGRARDHSELFEFTVEPFVSGGFRLDIHYSGDCHHNITGAGIWPTVQKAVLLRNATPSVLHQRHIGRVLRSSCNVRGRRLASSRAREPRPGRCSPLWPGDLRNDGGSVAAAGADGSAA